jgi:hypothetical protein
VVREDVQPADILFAPLVPDGALVIAEDIWP